MSVIEAIANLREHQTQLDMDGVMVGVSRQALDELIAWATPHFSAQPDRGDEAALNALIERLEGSAKAFREHPIYTQDGDPVLLTVQADECEQAAQALAALQAQPAEPTQEARYLIRKGGYYYRPNAQGYTSSKASAGRYTLEEAIAHSHPNGPDGPRDGITYELYVAAEPTQEEVERVALAMLRAHFIENGEEPPTELGAFDNQYRKDAKAAIAAMRGEG